MDAADIRYPTDLGLLNEAQEKTEAFIDILYEPLKGKISKPRTYRRVARTDYLATAKIRRPRKKQLCKAIRKQLGYLCRNLKSIKRLGSYYRESPLSVSQALMLGTIEELYRQQKYMYDRKTHSVPDRIISISQPHVRPIVRGKAKANIGAKLAISVVDGFAYLERLSWDNFNEGMTFKESVGRYKLRLGCYPASIRVNAIYRICENISYCQERGIRISGPRLGRPPKELDPKTIQQARQDAWDRNCSEGKFGEGKRRYGMALIKGKLQETSETVITMNLIVMNLARVQRGLFVCFSKSGFRVFWAKLMLPAGQFLLAAA